MSQQQAARDREARRHRLCERRDHVSEQHMCGLLNGHYGEHACPCGERWFH